MTRRNESLDSRLHSRALDYVLLLDLDGTLIDSDTRLLQVFTRVLAEFGYADDKIKIALEGMHNDDDPRNIMQRMGMNEKMRCCIEKRLSEAIRSEKTELFPNALQVIDSLSAGGFIFSIVTHNYYDPTIKFLQENGIISYFDKQLIFSHDNFPVRKPSKEIVNEIFKRTQRSHGIVIGNAESDVRFAENAELPIIMMRKNEVPFLHNNKVISETFLHDYQDINYADDWMNIPSQVWKIVAAPMDRRMADER